MQPFIEKTTQTDKQTNKETKRETTEETKKQERKPNCFQIVFFWTRFWLWQMNQPKFLFESLTVLEVGDLSNQLIGIICNHLSGLNFTNLFKKARPFYRTVNFLNSLNGLTLSTKHYKNLWNWLQGLSNPFHSLEGKLLIREWQLWRHARNLIIFFL